MKGKIIKLLKVAIGGLIESKTSYWLSFICLNELLTYSCRKCMVDCIRSQLLGNCISCTPHIYMYLPTETTRLLCLKCKIYNCKVGGW